MNDIMEAIALILQSVEVRNDGLWFMGKRFPVSSAALYRESRQVLMSTLYNNFYCTGGNIKMKTDYNRDIYHPDQAFVAQLEQHTRISEGVLYDAFYFVHSKNPAVLSSKAAVRFYFNCNSTTILKLLEWLSFTLNTQRVPFMFKCLAGPLAYPFRNDSAVLYLENKYADRIYNVIYSNAARLKAWTENGVPLFTKPLFKGIGFGENTIDTEESFGTLRCALIADLLIAAFQSGKQVEAWPKYIATSLKSIGFTDNAFFLNPGSKGFYHFLS